MKSAEEKITGGKLVNLIVQEHGDRLVVQVAGDFFIHPEEGIRVLEETLCKLNGTETVMEIEKSLSAVIEREMLELIGIDVQAIARLYRKCMRCGE